MRKPDTAFLRNIPLTNDVQKPTDDDVGKYGFDGSALLHRVSWHKGMLFTKIKEAYVNYVSKKYGSSYIVFDGYNEACISVKSKKPTRRTRSKGSSQNVVIRPENPVPYSKERFLSNQHNKSQLLSLLSDFPRRDGQMVLVCEGDSDTKIVATDVDVAKDSTTIVVSDDTDVAIISFLRLGEERRAELPLSGSVHIKEKYMDVIQKYTIEKRLKKKV